MFALCIILLFFFLTLSFILRGVEDLKFIYVLFICAIEEVVSMSLCLHDNNKYSWFLLPIFLFYFYLFLFFLKADKP